MATSNATGPVSKEQYSASRGMGDRNRRSSARFALRRSLVTVLALLFTCSAGAQQLKSIIYDFDGFDLGVSDLPEGDYSYGDLTYSVALNPFAQSGQLGDRVLRLDLNWNDGYGAFGRGISRFLQLSKTNDRFNFYFAAGSPAGDSVTVEITIAEDDNSSGNYEAGADDSWRSTVKLPPKTGWQLCSVPLSSFADDNTGGNGTFDCSFQGGKLLLVELRFDKSQTDPPLTTYYVDMLCFSESSLPQGLTPLTLPAAGGSDHCLLGAHMQESPGQFHLIPQHFHSLLPKLPFRKIRYVNTFMQWATDGSTTPHMLPGSGYQQLLDNGYRPVITWEPMFAGFGATHSLQPTLDRIAAGDFDNYIDAFAAQLKTYSDTVIIRLMHEFDGDWYPWSIALNGQDPAKYVSAFRHIVDRVRQKGVKKIQWMWCPNSDFTPQASWNWAVTAYPGDAYVDIVATDVYNAHYPPGLPWWRSFRWQTAEIYYYLTEYFPSKPFFICETACRERTSAEPAGSQDKAGWIAAMDRELQSHFKKTRALIFFSEDKSEQWSVNSSQAALNSLRDHIWEDDYYFRPFIVGIAEEQFSPVIISPVPTAGTLKFDYPAGWERREFRISDVSANVVFRGTLNSMTNDISFLPPGVYFVRISGHAQALKIILQ